MFGLNSRKRKIAAKARAIDIKDYHNLCRLCITKTSNKVNIFHEHGIRNQLFEKILNCLSLFVSEDDELPKYVCNGCINRLEDVEAFKDKCHESEEILKTYVSFDISKGKRAKKKKRQQKSVEDRINEAETVFLERAIKQEQEDFDDVDGVIDVVHGEYPQIGLEAFGTNIDNNMNQEDSLDSVSECGIASTSSLTTSKGNNSETPEVFPRVLSEKDIENLFVNSSDRLENIMNSDNPSNLCEMQIVVDDSEASEVAPVKSGKPPSDLAACNEEADRYSEANAKDEADLNKLVEEVSEFVVLEQLQSKNQEDHSHSNGASQPELRQADVVDDKEVLAFLIPSTDHSDKPVRSLRGVPTIVEEKSLFQPNYISLLDSVQDEASETLPKQGEILKRCVNIKSAFSDPSTKRTIVTFQEQNEDRMSSEKSKFMCLKCGRFFGLKRRLFIHLRVHRNIKPFSCPVCGSKFRQKSHVTKHLITHTGARPFSCKHCGRRFSAKNSLDRHVLVHVNRKPFKCRFCPAGFTRRENLAKHERIHFM